MDPIIDVNTARMALAQRDQMDKFLEKDGVSAGGRDDDAFLDDIRVEARRQAANPGDFAERSTRNACDSAADSPRGPKNASSADSRVYQRKPGRPNTGPKAVRADHDEFQRRMYDEWAYEQQEKIRIWEGKSSSGVAHAEAVENEPDDSDDDDAFLKEYRAKRLAEMQRQLEESMINKPRFGKLRTVDADRYFSVVEEERPEVTVVVAFSDSQLQICRRLDKFLGDLAARHPFISFVRVPSEEVDGLFGAEELPVLIFYRGGEALSTVPRLGAHLGSSFTAKELSRLLAHHEILPNPDDSDIDDDD